MGLNVFAEALGATLAVSFAFHLVELAVLVVGCNVLVLEDLGAPSQVVATFELHFRQLLFHLFLDAQELGLFALHWAHPCLIVELF